MRMEIQGGSGGGGVLSCRSRGVMVLHLVMVSAKDGWMNRRGVAGCSTLKIRSFEL